MTNQTTPAITATTWTVDPSHTLVEFSVRHMMVTTVKGRFTDVKATIHNFETDPSHASLDVEIATASLTTGDDGRDNHLRSADFFEVETYPTVTFKSSRVEGNGDEFKVTGDLTLHGVTKEVTLDVTFHGTGTNPWGKTVAGFAAETKINRKDFGLNWNVGLEAGGVLVSDQIKISIDAQVVKQDA